MKVEFLKDYRLGGKQFLKGDVARIHWTEGQKLIKKKIAKETNQVTDEDKVLKQFLRDGDNGEN